MTEKEYRRQWIKTHRATISVQIGRKEYGRLKEEAEKRGLRISDLVRKSINEYVGKEFLSTGGGE